MGVGSPPLSPPRKRSYRKKVKSATLGLYSFQAKESFQDIAQLIIVGLLGRTATQRSLGPSLAAVQHLAITSTKVKGGGDSRLLTNCLSVVLRGGAKRPLAGALGHPFRGCRRAFRLLPGIWPGARQAPSTASSSPALGLGHWA